MAKWLSEVLMLEWSTMSRQEMMPNSVFGMWRFLEATFFDAWNDQIQLWLTFFLSWQQRIFRWLTWSNFDSPFFCFWCGSDVTILKNFPASKIRGEGVENNISESNIRQNWATTMAPPKWFAKKNPWRKPHKSSDNQKPDYLLYIGGIFYTTVPSFCWRW